MNCVFAGRNPATIPAVDGIYMQQGSNLRNGANVDLVAICAGFLAHLFLLNPVLIFNVLMWFSKVSIAHFLHTLCCGQPGGFCGCGIHVAQVLVLATEVVEEFLVGRGRLAALPDQLMFVCY